jgi:hypothetical protein
MFDKSAARLYIISMDAIKKIIEANADGLAGQEYEYDTQAERIANWLGRVRNVSLAGQPVVSGYRYGAVPQSLLSQNYAEDKPECGVSLAALDGQKEIGSTMWFSDRKKVAVRGILVPRKGSDGEPLVIPF